MNGVERMRSQLGGHIRESMGGSTLGATGGPLPATAAPSAAQYQGITRPKDALTIEVARLAPDPDQPRKEFDSDALANLAASLKARGQLQPIRVRWDESASRWLIVAGERRYRAALLAGLPSLMCVEAKGSPSAEDILEDQLVENCVREDLKPIEQATAFKALLDRRGWSYRKLAETLSISHMAVGRALALLELPTPIQAQVERGELAPSVAYEVSKLANAEAQADVAARVVAEGLNRAEVVEAVRERAARSTGAGKGRGAKSKSRRTSATIRTASGMRITFEHRRGVDDATIRAALSEALAVLDGRAEAQGEAA